MNQHLIRSNNDLKAVARMKVILPGDREPAWLHRNAVHAQIFKAEAIERKVAIMRGAKPPRRNFVARLIPRRNPTNA